MTSSASLVTAPGVRVRVSADLLGMLSARLTDRDRQIAQLLIDHQVPTTAQMAARLRLRGRSTPSAGDHAPAANARPAPPAVPGSRLPPLHYVLEVGRAAIVAIARGVSPAEFGFVRERAMALALARAVGGALAGPPAAAQGPGRAAITAIPASYLALYQAAAATCPGLPRSVLAAIGTAESGTGANDGPSPAGAVGSMQFELPPSSPDRRTPPQTAAHLPVVGPVAT